MATATKAETTKTRQAKPDEILSGTMLAATIGWTGCEKIAREIGKHNSMLRRKIK